MIHISGHRWGIIPDSGYCDKGSYFCVNCCGYEKYITKNIKTHRKAGRLDYQVIYIVKGSGSFLVDGEMTEVASGSIVVFHPGEIQRYEYQYNNTPELYWVHFTGFGAESLLEKVGLSRGQVHYVGIHNTCIEYFKKITLELQLKPPLYQETADAALLELLALFGRKKAAAECSDTCTTDINIQNILEKMHTDCAAKWNIGDLARQSLLSPNSFMHRFKAQTGYSALEYVIKIRLDKARDLLLNSSLSVKEISNLVGYENPLYFSRLFRKTEGISPREYRAKHLS